ncbi:mannose-6-phosphate isomerase-like protein (cupin superfamily) [Allocatelliglobosispora scoriae]|uniref:Mannose-6-phosphate isomerase-like protein (Cupin superfamily) n=1 Tax=Allocatelliglobosispora scoriae TaxID=643052 RepID=A0A841BZY4_9ACTN|nr:cysteine dioxygenase family protein [Allocatelliglobosispora scoriae]MBB5872453.1 mannose-6-phosphate isomerase-like protein (cupin superfamily) [Allocatelliglobosispora scoriae]
MVTVADLRVDHLAIALQHARPETWPVPAQFTPERRWFHRISGPDGPGEDRAGFEVWLLTWLPGQHTELHDHGGSAGAFTVVAGSLTEETVGANGLHGVELGAGAGRRFGAHHVHRIRNNGDVPAISVHVYGPALRIMTRYDLEDGKLVPTGVDQAGVQW